MSRRAQWENRWLDKSRPYKGGSPVHRDQANDQIVFDGSSPRSLEEGTWIDVPGAGRLSSSGCASWASPGLLSRQSMSQTRDWKHSSMPTLALVARLPTTLLSRWPG